MAKHTSLVEANGTVAVVESAKPTVAGLAAEVAGLRDMNAQILARLDALMQERAAPKAQGQAKPAAAKSAPKALRASHHYAEAGGFEVNVTYRVAGDEVTVPRVYVNTPSGARTQAKGLDGKLGYTLSELSAKGEALGDDDTFPWANFPGIAGTLAKRAVARMQAQARS